MLLKLPLLSIKLSFFVMFFLSCTYKYLLISFILYNTIHDNKFTKNVLITGKMVRDMSLFQRSFTHAVCRYGCKYADRNTSDSKFVKHVRIATLRKVFSMGLETQIAFNNYSCLQLLRSENTMNSPHGDHRDSCKLPIDLAVLIRSWS